MARRDHIMAPSKVLVSDPCSLGLPEGLTGAHGPLHEGSKRHYTPRDFSLGLSMVGPRVSWQIGVNLFL